MNDEVLVLVDDVPVLFYVRAGLTGNNDVFPVLLLVLSRSLVRSVVSVGMVRILAIQRGAGSGRKVQAWGLFFFVVTEATCDHLCAVGGCQVQAVGSPLGTENLPLQVADGLDGCVECVCYGLNRVVLVPSVFAFS